MPQPTLVSSSHSSSPRAHSAPETRARSAAHAPPRGAPEAPAHTALASCLVGVGARPIEVEARIAPGLPAFELVGLPERGVRESRVRVRSAIGAQGFQMPKRQLVVNLAPGDLRKTGTSFDLAIAMAVLAAGGGFQEDALRETLLLGELSLSGELRGIRGVLPHLLAARDRGMQSAIVPAANQEEAALVQGIDVRVARTLREVVEHLDQVAPLSPPRARAPSEPAAHEDLRDVRGQALGRRALEIAAAGAHHLLFVGPPGAGKTMLARRLPRLLPPPTSEEALQIATIASAAGLALQGSALESLKRPFRAPHHTASAAALVGGGDPVRPGEVTLAHRGVLFLDELPEFRRDAIETLRTTMERGEIHISRARERVLLPAAPLVIAAMNPCPCGHHGDPERLCHCSLAQIERYAGRISGPLMDRFDLQLALPRVKAAELRAIDQRAESSAQVQTRILRAREAGSLQRAQLDLQALCKLAEEPALRALDLASEKLKLSARSYVKILRVASTLSLLDARDPITRRDVLEALQFRLKSPGSERTR